MKSAEHLVGHEWAEWYRLTPVQRWQESTKLWQTYLALGGTLDPEPDTQSPFFDPKDAHQTSPKQRRIEKTVRLQWSAELESLRLTK